MSELGCPSCGGTVGQMGEEHVMRSLAQVEGAKRDANCPCFMAGRNREVYHQCARAAEPDGLFESGDFTLHSGETSSWRINCEALTFDDLETLAAMIHERIGDFAKAEGVPAGGLRLAEALNFLSSEGPLLIVDDVLTTGASMEQQRAGRDAIGAVIFARGPCPSWVKPLFSMEPDGLREALERIAYGDHPRYWAEDEARRALGVADRQCTETWHTPECQASGFAQHQRPVADSPPEETT